MWARALAFMLCIGCTAHVTGAVQVDDRQFYIADCRSGQVFGFAGVDLIREDGSRLRLVYDPVGQARVYLLEGGTGVEVGLCGPFALERQGSRINMIYNMRGRAQLQCVVNGRSVVGEVAFENCH